MYPSLLPYRNPKTYTLKILRIAFTPPYVSLPGMYKSNPGEMTSPQIK